MLMEVKKRAMDNFIKAVAEFYAACGEILLRRNDEFISIDGRKETNLEQAKVKDEEIKAVLDGAGVGYTVISPWETDKVLLDLKMK